MRGLYIEATFNREDHDTKALFHYFFSVRSNIASGSPEEPVLQGFAALNMMPHDFFAYNLGRNSSQGELGRNTSRDDFPHLKRVTSEETIKRKKVWENFKTENRDIFEEFRLETKGKARIICDTVGDVVESYRTLPEEISRSRHQDIYLPEYEDRDRLQVLLRVKGSGDHGESQAYYISVPLAMRGVVAHNFGAIHSGMNYGRHIIDFHREPPFVSVANALETLNHPEYGEDLHLNPEDLTYYQNRNGGKPSPASHMMVDAEGSLDLNARFDATSTLNHSFGDPTVFAEKNTFLESLNAKSDDGITQLILSLMIQIEEEVFSQIPRYRGMSANTDEYVPFNLQRILDHINNESIEVLGLYDTQHKRCLTYDEILKWTPDWKPKPEPAQALVVSRDQAPAPYGTDQGPLEKAFGTDAKWDDAPAAPDPAIAAEVDEMRAAFEGAQKSKRRWQWRAAVGGMATAASVFGAAFLYSQNSDLQGDVNSLTADVVDRDAQIADLTAKLDDRNTRITKLQGDLSAQAAYIEHLISSFGEIGAKNQELVAALSGQTALNEALRAEKTELNARISALQKERNQLSEELEENNDILAGLRAQSSVVNADREALNAQIRALEAGNDELVQQIAARDVEIGGLKDSNRALGDAFKAQIAQLDKLRNAILQSDQNDDNLLGVIAQLTAQQQALLGAFSDAGAQGTKDLKGEIAALRSDLENRTTRIIQLERDLAMQAAEIDRLMDSLAEADTDNKELNNRLAEQVALVTALREEKDGLKTQISDLQQERDALSQELTANNIKLAELRRQLSGTDTDRNALAAQILDLETRSNKLLKQLDARDSEIAGLRDSNDVLDTALAAQIAQFDQVYGALSALLESGQDIDGLLAFIAQQGESFKVLSDASEEERRDLETELARLQGEGVDNETRIAALNARIAALTRIIAELQGAVDDAGALTAAPQPVGSGNLEVEEAITAFLDEDARDRIALINSLNADQGGCGRIQIRLSDAQFEGLKAVRGENGFNDYFIGEDIRIGAERTKVQNRNAFVVSVTGDNVESFFTFMRSNDVHIIKQNNNARVEDQEIIFVDGQGFTDLAQGNGVDYNAPACAAE